jgi:acyl-coenzyme A thioesterase PaaI-like protein
MASGLATSGSVDTGNWVSDGMVFSLVDSVSGQTIASVTTDTNPASSQVSFTASPNPITPIVGTIVGKTILTWDAPGFSALQIWVAGKLMASGLATSGSADTGNWVSDGMIFSLVDSVSGQTIANVTAVVKPGATSVF